MGDCNGYSGGPTCGGLSAWRGVPRSVFVAFCLATVGLYLSKYMVCTRCDCGTWCRAWGWSRCRVLYNLCGRRILFGSGGMVGWVRVRVKASCFGRTRHGRRDSRYGSSELSGRLMGGLLISATRGFTCPMFAIAVRGDSRGGVRRVGGSNRWGRRTCCRNCSYGVEDGKLVPGFLSGKQNNCDYFFIVCIILRVCKTGANFWFSDYFAQA